MKGNEFFQKLGSTLGMSADQIAKLNGIDALKSMEISDEVATMFNSVKVFTEESAKANPEIRAAIRAEDLNGLDSLKSTLLDKYGLPDDIKATIKSEKKTSAWLNTLLEKAVALEAEKATSSGKAKTELEKEIEKLNAAIVQERSTWEGKVSDLEKARYNDRVDWELKGLYSNFDYAMGEVEKPIAINAAKAVVEQKLREKGVLFKMTENGLAPFISKDGQDMPFFDNNQKIGASDLIKRTLLENKLLKVNDNNQQQHQQRQQSGVRNPEIRVDDSNLKNTLKEAFARDGFGG